MIHNIKSIAARGMAAVIAMLPICASAQNLQSGYFDDNYLYRFQSNPAFGNEGHGFVAMPGLGNLNLATNGTIGVMGVTTDTASCVARETGFREAFEGTTFTLDDTVYILDSRKRDEVKLSTA